MHLPSFKFWRLGLPLKVVELGLLLLLNFDLYSANFNLKIFVDRRVDWLQLCVEIDARVIMKSDRVPIIWDSISMIISLDDEAFRKESRASWPRQKRHLRKVQLQHHPSW